MVNCSVLSNLMQVGQVTPAMVGDVELPQGVQQGGQVECAWAEGNPSLIGEQIIDNAFLLTSGSVSDTNIVAIEQNMRNVLNSANDNTIAADAQAKYEIYNAINAAISTINASKIKIDTVRTNNFNAIRDARQIPFENIKSQIRSEISKYPEDIDTDYLPPLLLNLANKISTQNEIKLTYQNALQSYNNFLSPPRQNIGLVLGSNNTGSGSGSSTKPPTLA